MSLLGDIWDAITSWVMSYVASAIAGIQRIVNNVYNTFATYVMNSYNYWTQVIQNTINNIVQYVTNSYNYWNQYLTNVYNNVTNYLTNVYNNIVQNITNVTQQIITNVTNVVGASMEWVNGRIAGIDTVGFFKDPLGYIKAAFTGFIDYWIFGVIRAFSKGLDEGLAGSNPANTGPGLAFERGFRAALEEQDGHMSHG